MERHAPQDAAAVGAGLGAVSHQRPEMRYCLGEKQVG